MPTYYDNSPPDDHEPAGLMDVEGYAPPIPCHCRHCRSEGLHDQDRDCVYWRECDAERGHHGDRCRCLCDAMYLGPVTGSRQCRLPLDHRQRLHTTADGSTWTDDQEARWRRAGFTPATQQTQEGKQR